jgi:hypothetical protein
MYPEEYALAVVSEILQNEPKFVACWQQIRLLSTQISEMEERLQRAESSEHQAFADSLQLRLSTTEGMRSMYLEYARRLGNAVWDKLEEAGLLSDDEDMEI